MTAALVNPTPEQSIDRLKVRISRLNMWLQQAESRKGTDRAYPECKVASMAAELKRHHATVADMQTRLSEIG